MGNNHTKERVARAGKSGSLTLSGAKSRRKKVPPEVWALGDRLVTLSLAENLLTVQALEGLSRLTRLKHLSLADNRLDAVPGAVSPDSLPRLETLTLDRNRIAEVPPGVFRLPRLKRLALAHNLVAALPAAVGEAARLEELDVSHNRLRALPPEAGALSRLRELACEGNAELETLPAETGGLRSLTLLRLGGTALRELPEALLRDTPVASLSMEGTPLDRGGRFYQAPGFDAFQARHKAVADKKISAGLSVNTV